MVDETSENLCCPPDCCDMRGFLTFQILWELSRQHLSGQEIADKIAQRKGSKPSPGTIYPALKELRESDHIEGKKVGRKIIYRLTESGTEELNEAARYFHQVFGDIAEGCKAIAIRFGDCDC